MNIDFTQAVHNLRAALWRIWCCPFARTTTVHGPASFWTGWAAGDQAGPDLLARLVDPADALFIAVAEAGRRSDP